jgi:hypothetical protein
MLKIFSNSLSNSTSFSNNASSGANSRYANIVRFKQYDAIEEECVEQSASGETQSTIKYIDDIETDTSDSSPSRHSCKEIEPSKRSVAEPGSFGKAPRKPARNIQASSFDDTSALELDPDSNHNRLYKQMFEMNTTLLQTGK